MVYQTRKRLWFPTTLLHRLSADLFVCFFSPRLRDKRLPLSLSPSVLQLCLGLCLCTSIKSIFLFLHLFARSPCVVLNQTPSFKQHVFSICRVAYLEFRIISTIRHYLSVDATKILIRAFVLSRIDYCNSLHAGFPKYLLDGLKKKKKIRIMLHVLSSNLQNTAMFRLFFAQCTGFPSPRE